MLRLPEKDIARGLFNQLAGVHNSDTIRHFRDHAQVMCYQQHGHATLFLHLSDQFQHLRLDGDIQRSGRLIGDQQIRITGQRHSDHDALFHTAGQLVRVFAIAACGVGDTDIVQQFHHPLLHLPATHTLVLFKAFCNLVADGHHRIQRCHRLLEYHGDAAATHSAHAGFGQ